MIYFELERFYPSLSVEKVLAMTPQKTKYYVEAMRRLKAKERLEQMDNIQYPKLKQKDRNKKHRELYKQAYPENFKQKVIKTSDLELI